MNMNKLFLLVGLLSAGVAAGQTKTQTTKMSSTTTSTSNYNNSNTNNYNSQNATSGTNSSTNGTSTSGSMSGTGTNPGSTGSMGTGSTNSTDSGSTNGTGSGSTTPSTTSTYSTDTNSTTQPSGSGNSSTTGSSMGTTGNTTNGTYNNSTSMTPSGTSNDNTTTSGNGNNTITPSTGGNYNSAGTTNSTYSTATTTNAYPREKKDYKNFSYGVYVGANTTKFKGESFDANGAASGLTGRLGYQLGFFVRGGGRLYGQIGAEYFASSSNYFTTASGSGTTTATSIRDRIDIKYIQVPVYIGYKLTQSDRGISAVRVQVGLEYANQIGSSANQFGNLNNFQLKSGTFNGLGQIGFDAGPVFLDLTYHYGFSNAIEQNTGFAGSQRRILSASVGFKF